MSRSLIAMGNSWVLRKSDVLTANLMNYAMNATGIIG